MPTYQYRCPKGHEFERFERMSDRPRTKCPQCGRTAVRVISGGAGLIFKGSGFYITDYNGRNSAAITGRSEPKPDSSGVTVSSGTDASFCGDSIIGREF